MGVYADSSADPFDDPKVETIVELLTRIWGSTIGVVSTAFITDATPIALTGHTRLRSQYGELIDQALRGVTNYTWTKFSGPDVFYGAGAEQFIAGSGSFQRKDYYNEFAKAGYSISLDKTFYASCVELYESPRNFLHIQPPRLAGPQCVQGIPQHDNKRSIGKQKASPGFAWSEGYDAQSYRRSPCTWWLERILHDVRSCLD
jgi:hypothetical protein